MEDHLTDELIIKMCENADQVEEENGKAQLIVSFEGKEAQVVRKWMNELDRKTREEERTSKKQHSLLLRTNPEYRKWWESCRNQVLSLTKTGGIK